MARGLTIRAVTPLAGGGFEIAYTHGQAPLNAAATGTLTVRYPAAFRKDVRQYWRGLDPNTQLMLLLALTWLQDDGTFSDPSTLVGRGIAFDRESSSITAT